MCVSLNLSAAETPSAFNTNQAARLLAEAFEIIAEHYINELDIQLLFSAALSGMSGLMDEHSYFMTPDEAEYFSDTLSARRLLFGIVLSIDSGGNIIVADVLEDSSAYHSGILPGDAFVSLDGEFLRGTAIPDIIHRLTLIDPNISVKAEFMRDGEIFIIDLLRTEFPNPSVFTFELDELLEGALPDYGLRLIHIDFVGDNTGIELQNAIDTLRADGTERIILDLRGNGGGLFDVALDICRMLVARGPVFMMRDRSGVLTSYHSSLASPPFADVVVLIDRATASAGEIIAAALQYRGATVIGERSFGKSSMQYVLDLGLGHLRLTTHEILGPNGARIDGVGIAPDIEVVLPELIEFSYNTENIAAVKNLLNHLGYFDGPINESFDEAVKESIRNFRNSSGLAEGENIDIELIAALNATALRLFSGRDLVLERAYEYINAGQRCR